MDKFVIIDGNNIVFRSYYALPRLTNFDGVVSNGVFGFCNVLVKVIKEINPKYIAVCFDSAKKNFRHEMFKEYKGTRKPTPQELIDQFPILKTVLNAMGVKVIEKIGLEADDLIGCIANQFDNTERIIITADRDCLQLIKDGVKIMQPQKGITESLVIDEEKLKEIMGLTPSQIIDYKALAGDSSDNIPGVAGIGDKTAVSMLKDYSTLDGVYANLDKFTVKTREKLERDKDNAYLSYKLATIVTDEKLPYVLEDFEYEFPFNTEVLELFKKYQFNSLLKKEELFVEDAGAPSTTCDAEIIEINNIDALSNLVNKLVKVSVISFFMTDSCIYLSENDIEYKIKFITDLFGSGIDMIQVLDKLKPIFEDEKIEKIVFDYKANKHLMNKYGIELNGVKFDVMIARYLINSGASNNVTFDNMCNENLLDTNYFAYNLFILRDKYLSKMTELQVLDVFYNIEMPLVDVLYDMEVQGVKIDRPELENLENKYASRIDELTERIYSLAGKKFNINSPKQLAEVLFDDLGISTKFNKKRSTSAQVLQDIYDDHPIVAELIEYRQITKLYTTYIVAYKELLDKNDKIYTVFNQTLTTTGRLSSSEPNLQNIPVRTAEGRNLRKLFIPSTPGGKIVDADYNQIELRLLASFCGDEKLIKTYNEGRDIHTSTASEILGIDQSEVTPEIRRSAKAINFGIVYGISDYGLGQNIGITRAQANEYIKKYFERYPRIEEYMKSNVEYCKQHGFVRTHYGRVRFIPEINSSNYMQRTFGERAAMNMPLQGTASDVIKIAMIEVHKELKKRDLKSKLIIQVHDELLVDAVKEEVEDVAKLLKEVMENVANFKVKLLVEAQVGNNWNETH